ncbi:type 1 glutamine amidotransferase [Paraburkholderia pallida]|uniref:Type 1 glutamine amidotransferase n=1 Tax=Paraburkholderia pallida TaxID=2547399 RepID=A0A4V1AZF4_9BURK|nr:type 1 glutamine amidotransferase [Paraburkholderia pallida]
MSSELKHCKIAILAVDGFEESELTEPLRARSAAGAVVEVISQKSGEIRALRHVDNGSRAKMDCMFAQAKADDYDGVALPGGVINGDAIKMVPEEREFVRAADAAHNPVAAICHGGSLAGIVGGGVARTPASSTNSLWPSSRM